MLIIYSLQEILKKRTLLMIFVIFTVLFSVNRLQGQTAVQASTTAHVIAKVFTAITSVKMSTMNFGHFYNGSFEGKIINKKNGILSVKGDTDEGGDIHYSTSFDVSGNGNTTFTISYPQRPVTLTNRSVAKTLIISDWKSKSLPTTTEGELPLGYRTISLDATLKLGSLKDNPVGYYSGFYTITFGFN
jgi:hypothetical protein